MNKFSKLAAAAALAVAGVGAQAAFVIDDFSTTQATVGDHTTGDGGNGFHQVCGVGIIGGCRDLYVEKFGSAADDGFAGVRSFVAGGRLSYSQDTGQNGVGIVRWDGANVANAIDTAGLGGADLTAGMVTGIRVEVLSADLAGWPLIFQAWLDGDGDNNYTMFESTVIGGAGPGNYDFYFANFTGAVAADFDFSRVGAVQMIINNGAINDIDLQVDIIQNIPEPGTLALVGATLLGLGAARRRAKAA